jgi:hypothetical protein
VWVSDCEVALVGNALSESGAWRTMQDLPRWALGQAKPGGFGLISNGSGPWCSYGTGPTIPFQIFQRLSKYQTDSNL